MVYVDNKLIIDKYKTQFMDMVQYRFTVKQYIIEEQNIYLGYNIGKVDCDYGYFVWTICLNIF